jgi:hypothetical protein
MINGVQCAQNAPATGGVAGVGQGERDKVLSSAADLLKMSVDDLKSKLSSGQSLDDIAKAQGVSHDDLVANITKTLQADAPAGANASANRLDAMAGRIAGHHRHGHHHAAAPPSGADAPAPATTGSGSTINVLA